MSDAKNVAIDEKITNRNPTLSDIGATNKCNKIIYRHVKIKLDPIKITIFGVLIKGTIKKNKIARPKNIKNCMRS